MTEPIPLFERNKVLAATPALFEQGDFYEVERLSRALIHANKNDEEALFWLGQALHRQKRFNDALHITQKLLSLSPMQASYHQELGALFAEKKAWLEAEAAYRMAMVLNPAEITARFGLALALFHLGRGAEAMRALEGCEEKVPGLSLTWVNFGVLLQEEKDFSAAEKAFQRALLIDPHCGSAYRHLGNCHVKTQNLDAALRCFEQAIACLPDELSLCVEIADIAHRLLQTEKAEFYYRKFLDASPNAHDVSARLGLLLLLQERYEEGWARYAHRVHLPQMAKDRPRFTQPEWQGEPLAEKALLVYVEQGFGDNLQFVRYFPLLRAAHPKATLYYWTRKPLLRLFECSPALNGVQILPDSLPMGLPAFDYQIALLSLPQRFGTRADTIPAAISYLHAPDALVNAWGKKMASRLGGSQNKRVGLVWGGSETHLYNDLRSISLAKLARLFDINGIDWICLQKGVCADLLAENAALGSPISFIDEMNDADDFADTAAIIAHCDLVIGVDTAVIHLAAAMGKPVFLLNRLDTDWRWLINRTDSPWYPTLRIFQQTTFGDWAAPIGQLCEILSTMMRQLSAPRADS